MNDWTSGYVADVSYTYGYYAELNPLRSRLALLNSGVPVPEFATACELGFGQGVSTNIHAAASNCKWYGTDFSPSQAGFAQELASASQSGAELYDEAFDEFCNRTDLPDFDYIGLHGIWSWISPENRVVIVDFIRRKLKVGGVLYISYNTMPGWAAFAPLRHLMTQHVEIAGSEGSGMVNKIEEAIEFTDKLLATNPTFLKANPSISERMDRVKSQDKHYLAHEYFNRDWHPMHFSEMADALESAKVGYACSASYISNVDNVNFSPDQLKFLETIPDGTMKQTVRDFMVNQQFRQDYWVKGVREIPFFDRLETMQQEKVILSKYRKDISLKITCALGEATLNETIYSAVIDVLDDYKIHTIGEVFEKVSQIGVTLPQVIETMIILAHSGQVMSAQKQQVDKSVVESCEKLNTALMNLSRSNADQDYLASPVTGGGVLIPRLHQLFILAYRGGLATADELAGYTWQILEARGHAVMKDGKIIKTAEGNLKDLKREAAEFLEKRLVILKSLGILPAD
jgi:SAM-dependent methyltransferase